MKTSNALISERKPAMAFTLGAMGSPKTNFYNDAYCRAGFEDTAKEVQGLWVSRANAIRQLQAVPDELVLMANLIGTEDMVKARLQALSATPGVNTLRLSTGGETWAERTAALEEAMDLIKRAS